MKPPIALFILFIFSANYVFAQLYDNHWVFGNIQSIDRPEIGGTEIIFNENATQVIHNGRAVDFFATNASICDKQGNLMLSSNGMFVINSNEEIIENGQDINPGEVYNQMLNIGNGYICPQGIIILPALENDSIFQMVHVRMLLNPFAIGDKLFSTKVDMRENNGLGKVIEKNIPILEDSLSYGMVTAVKHANGRDYWILKPKKLSNGYYRILYKPEGFEEPILQNIGNIYQVDDGRGQMVFSPNGSKLARYDIINDLQIFDFDRCSGELSNPVHIEINDFADTALAAGGASFSPNSRYLYIPSFTKIYQFDTEASDIGSTQMTIGKWDGFADPFAATFYMAQLAPNGKIYITANNSSPYLHIIHQPDFAGLACNFEQRGLPTPTKVQLGMPHFPNYRLGALEGSPCDTIKVEEPEPQDTVDCNQSGLIFPNPTSKEISLIYCLDNSKPTYFILHDSSGKLVGSWELEPSLEIHNIVLPELVNGIYFYQIQSVGKRIHTGKVVIQG